MGLWVIAIAFVQNPQNAIATTIAQNNETILYANLYFFSWGTFLAAVFTVGVTFRDNFQFGPKFNQWMMLFTASVVLMATSVNIRSEVCAGEGDFTACSRTKYAIGVGAIGVLFSIIAVLASIMDRISGLRELALSSRCTVWY